MTAAYTPTPAFETARQEVAKVILSRGHDVQLLAYSLFKQTTAGDITGTRPGVFNQQGRFKFDAWTLLKGTAREEADARYLDCSEHMLQGKPLNPENAALLVLIQEQLGVNKSSLPSIW